MPIHRNTYKLELITTICKLCKYSNMYNYKSILTNYKNTLLLSVYKFSEFLSPKGEVINQENTIPGVIISWEL